MPTVDCIVSTHNRAARMLPRAARSVLAQSHTDLVLWIADDCSTDNTAHLARSLAKEDPRVRYTCTLQNDGYQCVPKNLALRAGTAPLIAYLDDDNAWHRDHLARLVAALEAVGADFVYCAREYANDPEDPSPNPPHLGAQMPWGILQITPWDPRRIRYENWIDTSDILHTRQAIEHLGGWNEQCRRMADWDLMQRAAVLDMKVVHVPEVLTTYYWHGLENIGRRAVGLPALWSLTHNRLYDIQRSFLALWDQTKIPFQHYVLDQGSAPDVVEWLADQYAAGRIHYLRLEPTNIGISRGSNHLLDAALAGDFHSWICKFDPDIEVMTPRWLERLIARCPDEKTVMSPHVVGLEQHPGGAPRVKSDPARRLGYVKHLGGAVNLAPLPLWKALREGSHWIVPAPAHGQQDAEFSRFALDKGWKMCHAEDVLVRHLRNVNHDAERRLVV